MPNAGHVSRSSVQADAGQGPRGQNSASAAGTTADTPSSEDPSRSATAAPGLMPTSARPTELRAGESQDSQDSPGESRRYLVTTAPVFTSTPTVPVVAPLVAGSKDTYQMPGLVDTSLAEAGT